MLTLSDLKTLELPQRKKGSFSKNSIIKDLFKKRQKMCK
jgi:hypothetical protein